MDTPPHTNTPVWDDHPWPGLPRLETDVSSEVCVVGLGGSGLAAITELLDLGMKVVGLDAGTIAGGAAGRNGGFLLAGTARFYHQTIAQFGHERARGMYQLTLEQMDRMVLQTPNAIRRVGSIRLADSAEELEDCTEQLHAMQRDGFSVEAYDSPEGQGLLFPSDGAFQPLQRCRSLAQKAVARGAQLFEHSSALAINPNEVLTAAGRVRCDTVIVAVDGRLEQVMPELRGRVHTARLQMLATAPAPEVSIPRPVYARWGHDYWQQLPDKRVTLGGFRDKALEEEWTIEDTPTNRIQTLLERFLRDRLHVKAPITHRWAASVAYTPNGLPILEEVQDGIWVLGAYSGTGNVVGALFGRAAAQMAVGGKSRIIDVFLG